MQRERWQPRLLSSVFGRPGEGPSSSPDGTDAALSNECRDAMRSVLETQIIPRLLRGRRPADAAALPAVAAPPTAAEVESFAALCAAGDRAAGRALVDRLRAGGLPTDSVLMELVAPAARHLGRQWEDDRLDFPSVTIGLMLMHELIHSMGYEVQDGPQASGAVLRVMLASAPGSQHVLGLSIVSEFFRQASRNPSAVVLLGGPVFAAGDLHAERFGAHAVCVDARECLGVAMRLLDR